MLESIVVGPMTVGLSLVSVVLSSAWSDLFDNTVVGDIARGSVDYSVDETLVVPFGVMTIMSYWLPDSMLAS